MTTAPKGTRHITASTAEANSLLDQGWDIAEVVHRTRADTVWVDNSSQPFSISEPLFILERSESSAVAEARAEAAEARKMLEDARKVAEKAEARTLSARQDVANAEGYSELLRAQLEKARERADVGDKAIADMQRLRDALGSERMAEILEDA